MGPSPSAAVKVTAGEMAAKIVSCLLCGKDFARQALKDHIACDHLNYVPHRCRECGFSCVKSEEMFHHAVRTGHDTVLNERDKNEYAEVAVELIYSDCVNASEEESTETQGMLPQPVGASRQAPSSLQVPRAFASSANPVVKQSSPFATTTGEMRPPRLTTSQRAQPSTEVPSQHVSDANPVVEQSNPNECQLCKFVVVEWGKRVHAREKHLQLTAVCPVSWCGFEVTSNFTGADTGLGNHVKTKHGFINLTSAEMAVYEEQLAERRRAVDDIYQECFPSDGR